MIRTSRQLKALVRNISCGNSEKARVIIRCYAMERFLERLSISNYRNNLILKGGFLISALVGINNRSTMDMDTTITSIPLTIDNAKEIVNKIINVKLDDGMTFTIKSIVPIMDEADYPGIRVILEAYLKKTRIPLKLDFSSGDVITPREITYTYKLLFEERSIKILAYNLETVLAEKFETIISKGTANSRMRDFYDVYTLYNTFSSEINTNVLKTAIHNTSVQRGSSVVLQEALLVVAEIENSNEMIRLWENYRKKFDYASDVRWNDVISVLRELCFILLRLP